MPVFAYRALTRLGRVRDGVVDAETRRSAWQALRAGGVFPTELSEERAPRPRRRRPGAAATAVAMRQLATLVAAGVPLVDALAAVAEQAPPALAEALTVARARVRQGEPLADGLAASPRLFGPLVRNVVRAGEASGALGPVLLRLAEHAETTAALRARLQGALAYPAVMTAATVIVLAFVLLWVLPQMTGLFAETGTALPLPTRLLLGVERALRAGWWAVLLVVAGGLWAGRAAAASSAGRERIDRMLLRVPGVGSLLREAAAGRLARTTATLLAGGVPLEAALGIAGPAVGNRRLAAAVVAAREAVRTGQALAGALAETHAFPPLLVQLVAVGERDGALDAALERAAAAHERTVATAVDTITALVEPALVLLVGAVVLALVGAVLLPLFELNALVTLP